MAPPPPGTHQHDVLDGEQEPGPAGGTASIGEGEGSARDIGHAQRGKPRTEPGLVRCMMLMANAKAAIAERWLSGCLRECAL